MDKLITNNYFGSNSIKNKSTYNFNKKSFGEVLDNINKNDELKFSKHAKKRIQDRDIELSTNQISKINEALEKAKAKGVKDALILMQDKAIIASVKNKTIVTITDYQTLNENVFTNIDGAVII